jgi:hypothetical protein
MEILCRNIPDNLKENNIKKALALPLAGLSIYTYHCRKLHSKGHAVITIGDKQKAQKLLNKYGQSQTPNTNNEAHNRNNNYRGHSSKASNASNTHNPNARRHPPPAATQLYLFNTPVYLSRSRHPPDEHLLQILEEDERKRVIQPPNVPLSRAVGPVAPKHQKTFFIASLSCGSWDYMGNDPLFVEYFSIKRPGKISFKKTALVITVTSSSQLEEHHVEFNYSTISGPVFTGSNTTPSLTFTAQIAPKLFHSSEMMELMETMETLWRGGISGSLKKKYRKRVTHLGGSHEDVAAACFTYRVVLREPQDLSRVRALSSDRHVPDMARWVDHVAQPALPYYALKAGFEALLIGQDLPFRVKYQLEALVWNGYLSPAKVAELMPDICGLFRRLGVDHAVHILTKLGRQLRYAGPDVDKSEFDVKTLAGYLSDIELDPSYGYLDSTGTSREGLHQISVHRATVTPLGIYLYGPTLETKNRVLRKYHKHRDYFLRVEFTDESGDPVRYDPKANLDEIFKGRFMKVLEDGIRIAGRLYQFLGFSHSSLRYQTCWFVAAFLGEEGELLDCYTIIPTLGNFSEIRSPARCAARIGQTFSDTTTSIAVDPNVVSIIPDVARNKRVFSDGVGTISKDVMHKIWREYAHRAKVKPTVFQIRFAGTIYHSPEETVPIVSSRTPGNVYFILIYSKTGAKGMVSLDSTLSGEHLSLRNSMIKFRDTKSFNIELCGAGTNYLPFHLNNQLIKILEDLGVPPLSFISLQAEEIKRLRSTTLSAEQAASFIEQSSIPKSTRIPWLIKILKGLGLRHTDDDFLRRIVELSVLVKLRDLKYRARIPVERAVTLYGIMDETGILREGEIFCPVLDDRGFREVLVRKNVVITRSPALHPGDVQFVNAVDVPHDSPLRKLHNCVVFSRHGARDLPSQLSGGDLDGDLYNVIFDDRLMPRRTVLPADYPREPERVLDREVTKQDIIEFFVTFMQQDQLGRIATTHMTIADQKEQGTFDVQCLLLAQLHSTAVDFSKTGVPVGDSRYGPFSLSLLRGRYDLLT